MPGNRDTSDRPSAPPLRVLIVDDSIGAAKILSLLLTKSGKYKTELAHDGPSAIEMAETFSPDVIFLDLTLPGLDGYEVATRLRAVPRFQSTMLIALTGNHSDEARRRSHETGFDHHILKPVGIEELQNLLATVVPNARG